MGSANGLNGLSQKIDGTTAGTVYSVCFWLANAIGSSTGGTPSSFEVRWNGLPLATLIDSLPFGYTRYQFTVRGTGTDTLRFDQQEIPHFWFLDDVSVQADTATPFSAINGPKQR